MRGGAGTRVAPFPLPAPGLKGKGQQDVSPRSRGASSARIFHGVKRLARGFINDRIMNGLGWKEAEE